MKTLKTLVITMGTVLVMHAGSAYAGGVPVIDAAAIANLVKQIEQAKEMIKSMNKQYDLIKKYAEVDHVSLASKKFARYLSDFRKGYTNIEKIMSMKKGGYQNMFDQIGRLDSVYGSYHDGWKKIKGESPEVKMMKKEMLWTKIQMKHAAKVGAAIRQTIPESQARIESLLNDTQRAPGMLLATKIGNQIMGEIGTGLQTLNVQMNEFLQAYAAKSLEENMSKGLDTKKVDELMADWGTYKAKASAKLNPVVVKE